MISPRILVVDDDPVLLKLLRQYILVSGFSDVSMAESAAEANRVWEENRGGIDLLITDFNLPGKTGDKLAVTFLREAPHLKVLFISGTPPEELESAIPLEAGRNFLAKPFTRHSFADFISRALSSHKRRTPLPGSERQ